MGKDPGVRQPMFRSLSADRQPTLRRRPRRSSSSDGTTKWWDARHHAVHCRPDAPWWTPAAKALVTGTTENLSSSTPPSYAGWPTTGIGNDRLLLKTRQAKMGGHVDWVTWAMESDIALKSHGILQSCDPDHPDSNWWPNYGAVGPDGFLTWAPDRLDAAGVMMRKLRQAFAQLLETPDGVVARHPAVAPRSAVLDLLDKFAPKHLPAEASQQWWEFRTHVATSSQEVLSWDDLAALLHSVLQTVSESQVHAPTQGPLAGALPYSDMVCTSLLALPVLNDSSAFAEARRLLKACGKPLVQRQLLLDGLLEPRSKEAGDVSPSLAEGSKMTRVARLAAGISEHPSGMLEEQAFLGCHRGSFVVALPDDGDPLPPWPPRRHRIIAARDSCSWASFDILALGVFDGDLARAIQQVETLWTAAVAYAESSGWTRPAFFVRCYPRCDANIPHIHAVDLDHLSSGLPVTFGPWDLPLQDALAALREEFEVQAGVIPTRLRAPKGSQEERWNTYFRDVDRNGYQLQNAMLAAHHGQDTLELFKKSAKHRDDNGKNPNVAVQTDALQASTLNFYSSNSLQTDPAAARLSVTEADLEEAMQILQSKLAEVRSATVHAVAALSAHGLPEIHVAH